MSPILVRPVREQLEHDRVIRLLQAKFKRKFDVAINPGNEQTAPVGTGPSTWYPDVVLQSLERGHKLLGTIEVETAESVNHLEAMSQWASLARLRAPFHLYVPAPSVDVARRLCQDFQISVAEMWAYHAIGDQMRFTLVHRAPRAADAKPRPAAPAARAAATSRARRATTSRARPAATGRARTAGASAARPKRPAPARAGSRSTKSTAKKTKAAAASRKKPARSSRAQKRK